MNTLVHRLARIGAIALLRKHRKTRKFDTSKVLTCLTADQARVHSRGYFADSLEILKLQFNKKEDWELLQVYGEDHAYRFESEVNNFALFYPIEEDE